MLPSRKGGDDPMGDKKPAKKKNSKTNTKGARVVHSHPGAAIRTAKTKK